jgi:peptide/nickel transport system ATP-binding protein
MSMTSTTPPPAPAPAVPGTPALAVQGLRVDLRGRDVNVVDDISFALAPGEIMGLIGESGSGKTTVAYALLGEARPGTQVTAGSVVVDGVDLLQLSPGELRRYWGGIVTYVPQDPGASLNPAIRIGRQLEETLAAHGVGDRAQRRERVCRMLEEVKLPCDDAFLKRYPHELSGGQQQRVVIANAFLCRPKVVVLDEPTTGLDVTTQAHVLRMVRELCATHRTAGVYVSHDLAVVAELADRIAVMYYGRLVEAGPAAAITRRAAHPYSRGLIEVIPDHRQRRKLKSIRGRVAPLEERPGGCVFAERCDFAQDACRADGAMAAVALAGGHVARCRRTETVLALPAPGAEVVQAPVVKAAGDGYLEVRGLTASYSGNAVLHGIDLNVPRGIVMALVGESGSGKTTLAKTLGGLHEEATGEMLVGGTPLALGARRRGEDVRRSVQYIFQNATEALNPRKTIGEAIAEPLRTLGGLRSGAELTARVEQLLADVALSPAVTSRYPAQLSGGERQRVTIARALATEPQVLICDEITSALDVSVQASILLLIQRLCAETDLTLLFVTHNLAVVRAIADRVAVLNEGRIVEEGPVNDVLDAPSDPYTQRLLQDTPAVSLV